MTVERKSLVRVVTVRRYDGRSNSDPASLLR